MKFYFYILHCTHLDGAGNPLTVFHNIQATHSRDNWQWETWPQLTEHSRLSVFWHMATLAWSYSSLQNLHVFQSSACSQNYKRNYLFSYKTVHSFLKLCSEFLCSFLLIRTVSFLILFFVSCTAGNQTQDLTHGRWVSYYWATLCPT